MLKYVNQYWLGGAATAAFVATVAVYLNLGDATTNSKKTVRVRNKLKPAGLVNDGNTCFINTTMQALASCFPIIHWLKTVLEARSTDEACKVTQALSTTLAGIPSSIQQFKKISTIN